MNLSFLPTGKRAFMTYLSTAQAAEAWGVSERSVRNYCAQGRVPGAFLTGKAWNIPETAKKPQRANGKPASKSTSHDVAPSPLLSRLREEKASRTKGGIYHKVQVEFAYNSNHIEGSRLSLEQTRLIFETATIGADDPVRIDDIMEASNHFHAVDHLIDNATKPLTENMLKKLHRILKASTTDARKSWFAVGEYKQLPNEVGGRQTTPPELVAREISALLSAYGPQSTHTLEDIVAFHVAFERIHPFQDGNGRVGRLIMFKECLKNNIVPFIIKDDMKAFYYRGLAEWGYEKGFLLDTCLSAQDNLKAALDYFRIEYAD